MRHRFVTPVAILLILAGSSARANPLFHSDPQFSVTDLGTSYSFQYGPDGTTMQGVINGAGDETYAYNKTPVVMSTHAGPSGSRSTIYSYTAGPYTASNQKYSNNTVVNSSVGWTNTNGQFPINDINIKGQVVGSLAGSARITLPDLQHHVIPSLPNDGMYGADMLDIYIHPVSGLSWLTSAIGIDDTGRILARGDNNHFYLLSPTPVPEPSSLMMFAIVGAGYGVLSVRRTSQRQP